MTVQDINDNRPACQPPFVGSVPENSEIGTLVMTVNASDSDEGENSQLSYRFLVKILLLTPLCEFPIT